MKDLLSKASVIIVIVFCIFHVFIIVSIIASVVLRIDPLSKVEQSLDL
jgi:hypothetical protein